MKTRTGICTLLILAVLLTASTGALAQPENGEDKILSPTSS